MAVVSCCLDVSEGRNRTPWTAIICCWKKPAARSLLPMKNNEKHWDTFKNQLFSKRQRSMRVGQLWLIRSFPWCQFDILALRRWRELIFPNILPHSGGQWLHRCRCFAAGRPVLAAQQAPSPIGRRNMLQDTACKHEKVAQNFWTQRDLHKT